ncbi:phage tail P2-like protein [Collimonas sp. PA-H2]|uniref:phage tail protein I n=1 Tax=Collimonas sp. PA-H2 TaxID=1881062 RepID=UPI000C0122AC|nr:phage tail protein I [Collimonas sp. PA-H2]PFH10859.1 phage tail P2-like protein [Collimonas sp. PA-H2]
MNNIVATLPPNAKPLERALATACARIDTLTVPVRYVRNPDTCPVDLLPFLAWEFSVDRWDDAWPEAMQRAAIKAAYYIHKHKGTIAAVRQVVEALGYRIAITEWWQMTPMGVPGTFQLDIGVQDTGITDAMYGEMERLIADAKPISRHLTSLAIQLESHGRLYVCATTFDGDDLTVYPWLDELIAIRGDLVHAGAAHTIDTMTIYP